jgi:hypothetical protein
MERLIRVRLGFGALVTALVCASAIGCQPRREKSTKYPSVSRVAPLPGVLISQDTVLAKHARVIHEK